MKLCLLLKLEVLEGLEVLAELENLECPEYLEILERYYKGCIVQEIFPVVIALWFHLFPFRTEKLSTVAPMVLHTRGRVGRRHFKSSSVSNDW